MSEANSSVTWLFGGSSALSEALIGSLLSNSQVVCFGRTQPRINVSFQYLDFSKIERVTDEIQRQYSIAPPTNVVFCQRYRPSDSISDLTATFEGIAVELGPLLALVDTLNSTGDAPSTLRSIVLLSSVAGLESHVDIPIYYHLLKSLTLAASRSVASHLARRGIRVNCLVLGEFLKGSPDSYPQWKIGQFDNLRKFSLSSNICSVDDICETVNFLLGDASKFITGAELKLDGGVSLLGSESIVRYYANLCQREN